MLNALKYNFTPPSTQQNPLRIATSSVQAITLSSLHQQRSNGCLLRCKPQPHDQFQHQIGMPPRREPTSRLKADDEWNKDFIVICVEEIAQQGYTGTSLTSRSCNRLAEDLSKKYNIEYSQRQLKQKWDYLRKQFSAWRCLEQRTGNCYDSVSGTFNFSDEVWDDIIKNNTMARQFRNATLEHKESLRYLFEGTLATGDGNHSNKHPIPKVNPRSVHALEIEDSAGFENNSDEWNDGAQATQLLYNAFFTQAQLLMIFQVLATVLGGM